MTNYSDVIIALHNLARQEYGNNFNLSMRLRFMADDLAKLGNEAHERSITEDKIQYQD